MPRSVRKSTVKIGLIAVSAMAASLVQPWTLIAQAPAPSTGVKFAQINPAEMKEILTYLASDALRAGRPTPKATGSLRPTLRRSCGAGA